MKSETALIVSWLARVLVLGACQEKIHRQSKEEKLLCALKCIHLESNIILVSVP